MARKLSKRSLRERDEADAEYKQFTVPMQSAARIETINDLRIPLSCRLFKQVIHGDGTPKGIAVTSMAARTGGWV